MKHLSVEQQALWKRISYFFVDDGKSSLSFIDRLMRENNWERTFALRAFDEYKKFMFLICIAEHPLTPSDEVDQVWHLHLLYTQSYWDELCGQILNKKIQHGPTKGGKKSLIELKKRIGSNIFLLPNQWDSDIKEIFQQVEREMLESQKIGDTADDSFWWFTVYNTDYTNRRCFI